MKSIILAVLLSNCGDSFKTKNIAYLEAPTECVHSTGVTA